MALAAPAAAQASGRDVACGATITSDTKLRADLTNCPGDGLVIGKDGITLDLGRRTIDGTGADGSTGIRLNGRREREDQERNGPGVRASASARRLRRQPAVTA